MPIYLLPLVAPAALLITAIFSLLAPGLRPIRLARLAEASALFAVAIGVASAGLLALHGPASNQLIGVMGAAVSVRLDAVSATMLLLVSFIGWVVVRYTVTYLDGEARQGVFIGWLCVTLASVLLLMLAGNLLQFVAAWIATSLFLHRLLLFYPDRVAAQRAARKKFVTARVGDAALIGAAVLLTSGYGTTDIATILQAARAEAAEALRSHRQACSPWPPC